MQNRGKSHQFGYISDSGHAANSNWADAISMSAEVELALHRLIGLTQQTVGATKTTATFAVGATKMTATFAV